MVLQYVCRYLAGFSLAPDFNTKPSKESLYPLGPIMDLQVSREIGSSHHDIYPRISVIEIGTRFQTTGLLPIVPAPDNGDGTNPWATLNLLCLFFP